MSARPTLKTIAGLSGLAVATVSRALKDAPDISAATKQKVRQIALEIGYVPDRAGVRLRTGKTNVISVVMSTEHEMMNMTARLISAIAAGLRGTRYHLNMTPFFSGDDPMRPIRYIVETASADAVIINQVEPGDPRVEYMLANGFPFAAHGRSERADEYPWFDFDNEAYGRLAVRKLAGRGRRRVLMVAPPLAQSYGRHMLDGAHAAARQTGTTLVVADRITSDGRIDDIRSRVIEILAGDPAIDGLLAASPVAAMAAVGGFEAHGLRIGRDFDTVAKDAIDFLRLFRSEIMIVTEDVARAGEFLARAAIQAATDPGRPPMQFLDGPAED